MHWRRQFVRQGLLEFDRQRKLMSVMCKHGSERILYVKGAPETVLSRCTHTTDESGERKDPCLIGAVLCMSHAQTSSLCISAAPKVGTHRSTTPACSRSGSSSHTSSSAVQVLLWWR
jgi:magnesium-transporting ATPase (P-type)